MHHYQCNSHYALPPTIRALVATAAHPGSITTSSTPKCSKFPHRGLGPYTYPFLASLCYRLGPTRFLFVLHYIPFYYTYEHGICQIHIYKFPCFTSKEYIFLTMLDPLALIHILPIMILLPYCHRLATSYENSDSFQSYGCSYP